MSSDGQVEAWATMLSTTNHIRYLKIGACLDRPRHSLTAAFSALQCSRLERLELIATRVSSDVLQKTLTKHSATLRDLRFSDIFLTDSGGWKDLVKNIKALNIKRWAVEQSSCTVTEELKNMCRAEGNYSTGDIYGV